MTPQRQISLRERRGLAKIQNTDLSAAAATKPEPEGSDKKALVAVFQQPDQSSQYMQNIQKYAYIFNDPSAEGEFLSKDVLDSINFSEQQQNMQSPNGGKESECSEGVEINTSPIMVQPKFF